MNESIPTSSDPNEEGKITRDMVREIVSPLFAKGAEFAGKEFTEDDLNIITKTANAMLSEEGSSPEEAIVGALKARLEARETVETSGDTLVLHNDEVVGVAENREDVQEIAKNEQENR